MVHRPTDSRLLTNLLSQDKDYSKQLYALLDAADASVASLSAYAAASAPPASQVIHKVAGSLANADDALRNYALSVDEWRDQLKSLKTLEEEMANMIRDREIFVTRVIKASRQKHHSSNGNLARSNQYSSSSSLSTSKSDFAGKAAPPGSSKLAHAQSQLQACEANLAVKERELALRRNTLVKTGLDTRFRAMINCGWAWGEIGKEALRTLEELSSLIDEQSNKPLLASPRPSSDYSSIGPSQSASQVNVPPPPILHPSILGILHSEGVGQPPRSKSPALQDDTARHSDDNPHFVMTIPAAHAISDIGMPVAVSIDTVHNRLPSPPPSNSSHENSTVMPSSSKHRSVSSISLKSLPLSPPGESTNANAHDLVGAEHDIYRRHLLPRRITEEDLDVRAIESSSEDVHGEDNLTAVDNPRFVKKGSRKQATLHPDTAKSSKQDRRSGSLLGSLRGFFGHHSRSASGGSPGNHWENGLQPSASTSGGRTSLFGGGRKNKWDMRIDKNLRRMNDKSDDEDDRGLGRVNSPSSNGGNSKRLRRSSDAGGSRRSLNGNVADESDGDDVRPSRKGSRIRLNKKRSSSLPPVTSATAPVDEEGGERQVLSPIGAPYGVAATHHQRVVTSASATALDATETSLSRRTSVVSSASAPGPIARRASLTDKSKGQKKDGIERTITSGGHARSVSLDIRKDRASSPSSLNGATASTSLMRIVEDVARANREAELRLREKKSWSMIDLIPGESTLSLTSSTATARPGSPLSSGLRASTSKLNGGINNGVGAPPIFVPRAPQSVSRQVLEANGREEELLARANGSTSRPVHSLARVQSPPPPQASITAAPGSPARSPAPKNQTGTKGPKEAKPPVPRVASPTPRPAQSPLRSALRNPTSRSLSPAPFEVAVAMVVTGQSRAIEAPEMKNGKSNEDDDSASTSSYETGREMFFSEEAVPKAQLKSNGGVQERISSPPPESALSGTSTSSTVGGESAAPQRRKSVRVSLQPTFSPTPPAIDDDDDDDEAGGPRNTWGGKPVAQNVIVNGWSGRKWEDQDSTDVWENSSDEDEEYANAKKLLNRVAATAKKGW